ncbi:SOS response-associated peptidase [bacterium]|nr:SOS response-associated peptidase [bacterium]
MLVTLSTTYGERGVFSGYMYTNICPSQLAGTIDAEGYRERAWSLVPQWSKTAKLKYSTHNARGETVADKPTFRSAWKASQRCVVPASAYFEWTGPKGSKQCHAVAPEQAGGFVFAGLWESWTRDGESVDSFTIVTVSAHPSIEWLHHRMPLMLNDGDIDCWLAGSPDEAGELIRPHLPSEVRIQDVESPKAWSASD